MAADYYRLDWCAMGVSRYYLNYITSSLIGWYFIDSAMNNDESNRLTSHNISLFRRLSQISSALHIIYHICCLFPRRFTQSAENETLMRTYWIIRIIFFQNMMWREYISMDFPFARNALAYTVRNKTISDFYRCWEETEWRRLIYLKFYGFN